VKNLPDPTADTPSLAALRVAFSSLTPASQPRWGRMQAAQMVRHCRVFVDLCLGRVNIAWPIRALARCFGPMFLRRMLAQSPTVAPKNLTTLKPLRISAEQLSLAAELQGLQQVLDELQACCDPHQHPLYGRMRKQDVIAVVRHHTAHHANQFAFLADAGVDSR
jgi:hypothetical protein